MPVRAPSTGTTQHKIQPVNNNRVYILLPCVIQPRASPPPLFPQLFINDDSLKNEEKLHFISRRFISCHKRKHRILYEQDTDVKTHSQQYDTKKPNQPTNRRKKSYFDK